MMNQNANEILSAGAKPHWLESTFGQALKAIARPTRLLERRRSFHMRLLELIRRPFRARRLRRNSRRRRFRFRMRRKLRGRRQRNFSAASAQSRKKTAGRQSTYSSGKRSFIRQM